MNLQVFQKFTEQAEPVVEKKKSLNQLLVYDLQDEEISKKMEFFGQKTLQDYYFKILNWKGPDGNQSDL